MKLKLAKDIAVRLSKYNEDDRSTLGNVVVVLDDRSTELEGQRNLLFAAAEEMLNLIESSDFDDIDGAPNNDDMNRWHRALQIQNSLALPADSSSTNG